MDPALQLQHLLLDLFSVDELRRFLRRLEGGELLIRDLPTSPASANSVAEEMVALLGRHRRIDAALFEAMVAVRGRWTAEIREVQRACECESATAPERSGGIGVPESGSSQGKRWLVLVLTAPIRGKQTEILDTEVQLALGPDASIVSTSRVDLGARGWREGWKQAQAMMRPSLECFLHMVEKDRSARVGVFAFAPIPLLAQLGERLSNKLPRVEIFQRTHSPDGWGWSGGPPSLPDPAWKVVQAEPADSVEVALMVSVSGLVNQREVRRALGERLLPICEIAVVQPRRDWLRHKDQLEAFRQAYRQVLDDMEVRFPEARKLHVFAAAPIPVAIELGRQPHPGSLAGLIVYERDQCEYSSSLDLLAPICELNPRLMIPLPGVAPILFERIHGGVLNVPSSPGLPAPWSRAFEQETVPPFLLARSPVTVAQWAAVRRLYPEEALSAKAGDPDSPVEGISWIEARRFAALLGATHGSPSLGSDELGPMADLAPRLPTEAEWELAAGMTVDQPLEDLKGVVWQWCADPWAETPGASARRVARGGSRQLDPWFSENGVRTFGEEAQGYPGVGVRLAADFDPLRLTPVPGGLGGRARPFDGVTDDENREADLGAVKWTEPVSGSSRSEGDTVLPDCGEAIHSQQGS